MPVRETLIERAEKGFLDAEAAAERIALEVEEAEKYGVRITFADLAVIGLAKMRRNIYGRVFELVSHSQDLPEVLGNTRGSDADLPTNNSNDLTEG